MTERQGDKEMSGQYRIITNGFRYRVQEKVIVGYFFWRHEKWETLCGCSPSVGCEPLEFSTLEEAQKETEESIAKERAQLYGWQPVNKGG